ncbi:MAG: hypothetical protein KKH74_07370 [Gammaproteobacteria bacterium]|nr:hypothetical protein [Gammaproteobacteria bacterium]MBU1732458.1 hypothetical protein [Gammaproteobacteria bacterium]MBU1894028.1 hypothetical protein [Gammaproteobacteria bacterium]
MFKSYVAAGVFALGLFSYAQYHGWSVWSVSESKPQLGVARSAYHK